MQFNTTRWWAMTLLIVAALFSTSTLAVTLFSVKIEAIFAQSQDESSAHLIQISGMADNLCPNGNRLYIDINDKALFAAALTHRISGTVVHVLYVTNAAPVNIGGHVAGVTCKAISIFG